MWQSELKLMVNLFVMEVLTIRLSYENIINSWVTTSFLRRVLTVWIYLYFDVKTNNV
jgi:hypothetical protein